MRRKLAAGNWKMNGSMSAMAEVEALVRPIPTPPSISCSARPRR